MEWAASIPITAATNPSELLDADYGEEASEDNIGEEHESTWQVQE